MSIKTIIEKPKKDYSFPKIGEYESGRVVLFTAPGTGTLLKALPSDTYYQVGHYGTSWATDDLTYLPSGSKITLEVE